MIISGSHKPVMKSFKNAFDAEATINFRVKTSVCKMELSWKTFEEELTQAAFAGSIKFWQIFLTPPSPSGEVQFCRNVPRKSSGAFALIQVLILFQEKYLRTVEGKKLQQNYIKTCS